LEISNPGRDVILTQFKQADPRGERYSHLDQSRIGMAVDFSGISDSVA
jgi:hypothetical protein